MATKTISTYIAAGYTLAAQYDTLDITPTGKIGGTGLRLTFDATVDNYGTVHATSGGANGISASAGATIVNGSASDTTASLYGYSGVFVQNAAATVTNFGAIQGVARYGDGVFAVAGGMVVNGAAADVTALIEGGNSGVAAGAASTVVNFGTVIGSNSDGVYLKVGGSVTNGSSQSTAATIEGRTGGVYMITGNGTVANFGTIASTGAAGVRLGGGGGLTNGSAKDTTAYIGAYGDGVRLQAAGSVANFGAIVANGESGVYLAAGGAVTNGSTADTTARIAGYHGVHVEGGPGTVSNFGAITGYDQSGVVLADGGLVTNGGKRNVGALIHGASNGVTSRGGATTIDNFGTILGVTFGVYLGAGSVTNGTANDQTALIQGALGLTTDYSPNITVTNFGTLEGAGGIALQFKTNTDGLVVEAGSAFIGSVLGAGGALELASGVGTLAGALVGGDLTVSGSMAKTTFSDFATLQIGAGADFTDKHAATIAAGQAVFNAGTLSLGGGKDSIVNAGLIENDAGGALTLIGAVNNTGTIAVDGGVVTVSGAVTNAGVAVIGGGVLDFTSTFTQNVTFTAGAGVLGLARSRSYNGTVGGFAGQGGTSFDLGDIQFVSAGEATYAGSKTKGVLTVTDGTHTAKIRLIGNYLKSTFTAASDGAGGTIVTAASGAASPPAAPIAPRVTHALISAMAGLRGAAGGLLHTTEFAPARQPVLVRPAVA